MKKNSEYLKKQIAEAKAKNENIIAECYIETHEEDDTIGYLDSNGMEEIRKAIKVLTAANDKLKKQKEKEKKMKKYIGTKIIKAMPMTRIEYNIFRGWKMPDDEDGTDIGYLVEYENGYISWSPTDVFNAAYRQSDRLSFGLAIEATKKGCKIARKGWNGKGMFVVYQKGYPGGIKCNKQTADAWGLKEGELFKCEPYLQIKMVNGSHSMWVPSVNDVLAEDWEIL